MYVCLYMRVDMVYLLATFTIMFLYFAVQHVVMFVAWAPGKFILHTTIEKS